MKEKTVILLEPVSVRGEKKKEIVVRASTVGDEEDAMQRAVQMNKARNPVTVELCLISRVSGIKYDDLRGMNGQDYATLRAALNELNGFPEGDADPLEMTTDTTPKSV